MTNNNQPLFETKAVSKATDQLMSVQSEQTITSQLDEISRLNFAPSTYTSDRVVRAQYIGCVDNPLLIFPQFINTNTILI